MNVSCPECRSVFRVDPAKLPTGSVRARCSVCGGVITVAAEGVVRDEFASVAAPPAPAAARVVPTPRTAPVVPRVEAPALVVPTAVRPVPTPPRSQMPPVTPTGGPARPVGTPPFAGRRGATPPFPGPRSAPSPGPLPGQPPVGRAPGFGAGGATVRRAASAGESLAGRNATDRGIDSGSSNSRAQHDAVRASGDGTHANQSLSGQRSQRQGAAAGPGADIRSHRVLPTEARGGAARRHAQAAVPRGDQEELRGIRGPDGARSSPRPRRTFGTR